MIDKRGNKTVLDGDLIDYGEFIGEYDEPSKPEDIDEEDSRYKWFCSNFYLILVFPTILERSSKRSVH